MNKSVVLGSVVVGVDGTPSSEIALAWAMDHAERHHRPVTLVHAAGHAPSTGSEAYRTEVRHTKRIAGRRIADHALGEAHKLAPSVQTHVWVAMGGPHEVLMEAASRASVLVVGTRGRGSIATLMLGSVSVGLSSHAPCPVVVARRPLDDPRGRPERRGIVVGVDGTDASAAAVDFAFELAATYHQPLLVAHAVTSLGPGPAAHPLLTDDQEQELGDQHELEVAESVAGYQEKFPDVVVSWQFIEDDPVADLVRLSADAEMVVVGSRGRGDAAAILLGSVSRAVVEHGDCSVAVVRKPLRDEYDEYDEEN